MNRNYTSLWLNFIDKVAVELKSKLTDTDFSVIIVKLSLVFGALVGFPCWKVIRFKDITRVYQNTPFQIIIFFIALYEDLAMIHTYSF